MPEQIPYYELDMGAPDPEPERPGDRRRRLRVGPGARLWLAILTALALGAALGGLGVRKERDAAADRAERTTVSLAATLAAPGRIDPTDDDDVGFHVQVFNAGAHSVTITRAAVSGRGYLQPRDPVTNRTVVQPGRWGDLVAVAGRPDCEAPMSDPPTLHLRAETVGGEIREVASPLPDPGLILASTRDAYCSAPAGPSEAPPVNMWVDAPFIHEVRAGRNVLRASLHIEVYGGLVQVVGGGHNDVFDLAVRDELPVTIASGGRAALTVELAVRRCIPVAAIDSADPLNVPVEVSRLDRQLTSTAWAQPQSIVQLVELLHRSCDQAGRSVGQKQD